MTTEAVKHIRSPVGTIRAECVSEAKNKGRTKRTFTFKDGSRIVVDAGTLTRKAYGKISKPLRIVYRGDYEL